MEEGKDGEEAKTRNLGPILLDPGGYKEISSIFADQKHPHIRVQMRGEGGVAGSQPMSTAVHIMWHGAQINFGDLTPYLTYGWIKYWNIVEVTVQSCHLFPLWNYNTRDQERHGMWLCSTGLWWIPTGSRWRWRDLQAAKSSFIKRYLGKQTWHTM